MSGEMAMMSSLGMDITDFVAGLKSALDISKDFTSKLISTLNKGVQESIQRVGNQFRQSGNYDITTAQLQKMQFQATQTGVQLNTMMMALRNASKLSGAASFGDKTANDTFKRLGIDAKAFAMMDVQQKLDAIGKSFESIHNSSQKAFLSTKLFYRNGVEMIQVLKELKANSVKFDNLSGGSTEKGSEDIYRAKEALLEVELVFESIYNQIAAKISPVITNVIHKMEAMGFTGVALKGTIDSIGKSFYMATLYSATFSYSFYTMGDRIVTVFSKGFEIVSSIVMSFFRMFDSYIDGALDLALHVANAFIMVSNSIQNTLGTAFSIVINVAAVGFADLFNKIRGYLNTLITGVNSINPFKKIGFIPEIESKGIEKYKDKHPQYLTRDVFDKYSGKGKPIESMVKLILDAFADQFKGSMMGTEIAINFSKVKSFLDSLFKGTDQARKKGPQDLIPDAAANDKDKSHPLGYAINATGTRSSLAALRMAFTPVQEVKDNAVLKAIQEQTAVMQGQGEAP